MNAQSTQERDHTPQQPHHHTSYTPTPNGGWLLCNCPAALLCDWVVKHASGPFPCACAPGEIGWQNGEEPICQLLTQLARMQYRLHHTVTPDQHTQCNAPTCTLRTDEVVHPSHSMCICAATCTCVPTGSLRLTSSPSLSSAPPARFWRQGASASILHVATGHQPCPHPFQTERGATPHTAAFTSSTHSADAQVQRNRHPAAGDATCKPYASAHRPLNRRGIF
jgi:hypothetical protein